MKYLIIISALIMGCTSSPNTNSLNNSISHNKKIEILPVNSETTLSELIEQCSVQAKVPILYFHADWCGPCVEFKKSLKDTRIINVFENALLLGVNIDSDPHNLTKKYSVNAVPTYIKLDNNATVITKITSAEWDEDIPQNIAPVMEKLINETVYKKGK